MALEESLQNDWRAIYRSRLVVERRWHTGDCRVISLPTRSGTIYSVQFDDALIAAGTESGSLLVYDARSAVLARHHRFDEVMVTAVAVEQGGLAAVGLWSGLALLVDLDTGTIVQTFAGHSQGVRCLLLGETLLTGSFDGSVRMWDRTSGACTRVLAGHTGAVTGLAWDEASGRVVSCSADGTVRLWLDCECIAVLRQAHALTAWTCIDLTDEFVIAGADDGSVCVWDTASAVLIAVLADAGSGAVTCMHAVARRLLTGAEDGIVRVWCLSSGTLAARLRGHTGAVASLRSDDTKAVSGGADQTIKMWDFAYDCANVDARSAVASSELALAAAQAARSAVAYAVLAAGMSHMSLGDAHADEEECSSADGAALMEDADYSSDDDERGASLVA